MAELKQPDAGDIIEVAKTLRNQLDREEATLRAFTGMVKTATESEGFDKSECIAQSMIALRALEDARMRLGKVIQYADGGVSVYDKPTEPATETEEAKPE